MRIFPTKDVAISIVVEAEMLICCAKPRKTEVEEDAEIAITLVRKRLTETEEEIDQLSVFEIPFRITKTDP